MTGPIVPCKVLFSIFFSWLLSHDSTKNHDAQKVTRPETRNDTSLPFGCASHCLTCVPDSHLHVKGSLTRLGQVSGKTQLFSGILHIPFCLAASPPWSTLNGWCPFGGKTAVNSGSGNTFMRVCRDQVCAAVGLWESRADRQEDMASPESSQVSRSKWGRWKQVTSTDSFQTCNLKRGDESQVRRDIFLGIGMRMGQVCLAVSLHSCNLRAGLLARSGGSAEIPAVQMKECHRPNWVNLCFTGG